MVIPIRRDFRGLHKGECSRQAQYYLGREVIRKKGFLFCVYYDLSVMRAHLSIFE